MSPYFWFLFVGFVTGVATYGAYKRFGDHPISYVPPALALDAVIIYLERKVFGLPSSDLYCALAMAGLALGVIIAFLFDDPGRRKRFKKRTSSALRALLQKVAEQAPSGPAQPVPEGVR